MGANLVLGIIGAAFGGWFNAASSVMSSKQEQTQLENELNFLEDEYELNKKAAELTYEKAKKEAERNAKQQEKQAELTDKTLDVTETGLSNDFNTAIDNMYLSQESDAYSWNMAAMQAGSTEGAELANIAGSGVRAGSSLSDAVEMESATNAAQLQFSQDAKRRSDSNNLASVLNGLAGNRYSIESNRIGADLMRDEAQYLRNSYLEGGSNYNLYKNQLDMLEDRYSTERYRMKTQLQNLKDTEALNAFASFFSGSAKGFSAGYNVGTAFSNMSKPDYSTTVGGKK